MPKRRDFIQGFVRLSYSRIFVVWVAIIMLFAGSYALLSDVPGHGLSVWRECLG